MELKNKTILVTGVTSGIGYALVKKLSAKNELIVIGRDSNKLSELREVFENITVYTVDLSKPDEVMQIADLIAKSHKEIDVLINNAAVQFTEHFLDEGFSFERISYEIQINLISPVQLIYLLLPSLLKKSRSIVLNINSGLGLIPKTSSAVYCGTKGGLNLFSQSLGYQFESTNIRVCQAFLPLVDTPMTEGRGKGKISVEFAASEIIKGIQSEKIENNIGKVGMLRFLILFCPKLAKLILKGA